MLAGAMKISKMIEELAKCMSVHGDIEVVYEKNAYLNDKRVAEYIYVDEEVPDEAVIGS